MAGTYVGAMNGVWADTTVIVNTGYQVFVDEVDNNTVFVHGTHFDAFEVLVTWSGINIEPVDASDANLTEFVWIADDDKLKFTYTKSGENETAYFIGYR